MKKFTEHLNVELTSSVFGTMIFRFVKGGKRGNELFLLSPRRIKPLSKKRRASKIEKEDECS